MAVLPIQNPSSLRVKLDLGLVEGKQKTKSKTYSNVKISATDQDIYDVAEAIMGLQKHTVLEIIKQDFTNLEG